MAHGIYTYAPCCVVIQLNVMGRTDAAGWPKNTNIPFQSTEDFLIAFIRRMFSLWYTHRWRV